MFLFTCLLATAGIAGTNAAVAGGDTAAPSVPTAAGDTLVVLAPLAPDPLSPAVGGLATRIDLTQETGSRDLAEILAAVAGLQVRRSGGVGASAVPSLRGSAAGQIRLFIDGIPVDEALAATTDLSRFPVERFDAVDIHRGVVPVGLGGIGGVGALDFRTKRRQEGSDLLLHGGSFGERGGRLSWGRSSLDGGTTALIVVHGRRADNDFDYLDPVGTYHTEADDTTAVRRNTWLKEYGGWTAVGAEAGEFAARATAGLHRVDGGRPGILGDSSPHASVRYDRLEGRAALSFREDLLRLTVAGRRNREWLYDPAKEVGLAPRPVTSSVGRDVTARLSGATVPWSASGWLREISLEAGGEIRGQRFQLAAGTDPDPERERTTKALFAQVVCDLAGGRLQVAPAWRWQRLRDNFPPAVPPSMPWLAEETGVVRIRDHGSPSLGAVWTLRPGFFFLEAHGARTVRPPSWVELFGHRGGVAGNRELRPEEITSVDAAISGRTGDGRWSGRLAVFRADTDETIVFIQNSPGTSKAFNAGASRTSGLELEVRCRPAGTVQLEGNLTLQRARDRSGLREYDGKKLPYLPDVEGWLRAATRWRRLRPWTEVSWQGANYRDRYNTELNRPSARWLLHAGLACGWNPPWPGAGTDLEITIEARNLTDNQVQDLEGFPLPGRTGHLAVRIRR